MFTTEALVATRILRNGTFYILKKNGPVWKIQTFFPELIKNFQNSRSKQSIQIKYIRAHETSSRLK